MEGWLAGVCVGRQRERDREMNEGRVLGSVLLNGFLDRSVNASIQSICHLMLIRGVGNNW